MRTEERRARATERMPLLVLFGANAVSMTGNVMALVAIPWFVLQTTGSASRTGIAAFFNFLPVAIAGFLGGALVDRLGYRRSSIVADVASGITVALIPLLYATVGLAFWQLLVLVFLGALLDAPGNTARSALVPELARRAGWSLERASGVDAAVERASRLAGSPLAGILIAVLGATELLWINAATFGVSALAVALAVPGARAERSERASRYLAEMREGFSFLWNDRVLRAVILTVTVTNFLDAATIVVAPVYADVIYDSPISLGLMLGAMGAGSVVSALVFAALGHGWPRRLVFAWCFTGVTVWYPVAAAFPSLPVLLAAAFLAGAAAGPLNPIIDTVSYERVPDGLRGRVFGLAHALAWMSIPLGVLVAGFVIELVGLRATLLATGVLYLLVTLTLQVNPAVRGMERQGS